MYTLRGLHYLRRSKELEQHKTDKTIMRTAQISSEAFASYSHYDVHKAAEFSLWRHQLKERYQKCSSAKNIGAKTQEMETRKRHTEKKK